MWRRGMSNVPLEVSQWGRPAVARSHTVKTGPINLTLEIALFQEQKRGRGRKNLNKINVNIMIMSCGLFLLFYCAESEWQSCSETMETPAAPVPCQNKLRFCRFSSNSCCVHETVLMWMTVNLKLSRRLTDIRSWSCWNYKTVAMESVPKVLQWIWADVNEHGLTGTTPDLRYWANTCWVALLPQPFLFSFGTQLHLLPSGSH